MLNFANQNGVCTQRATVAARKLAKQDWPSKEWGKLEEIPDPVEFHTEKYGDEDILPQYFFTMVG